MNEEAIETLDHDIAVQSLRNAGYVVISPAVLADPDPSAIYRALAGGDLPDGAWLVVHNDNRRTEQALSLPIANPEQVAAWMHAALMRTDMRRLWAEANAEADVMQEPVTLFFAKMHDSIMSGFDIPLDEYIAGETEIDATRRDG